MLRFTVLTECAAKALFHLMYFLKAGAIWMPQARGTLTHSVLAAIRGRTVCIGRGGKNPRALGILQDVVFMTRSSTASTH